MPFVPVPPEILALVLSGFLLDASGSVDASTAEDPEDSPPCPFHLSVRIPLSIKHRNGIVWDPFGNLFYPPWAHWKWAWQWEGKTVESHRGCPCDIGVPCLLKCCHLDGLSPMQCTHRNPVCPPSLNAWNSSSVLLSLMDKEVGVFALFQGFDGVADHGLGGPRNTVVRRGDGRSEEFFTLNRPGDERMNYCVKPSNDERLSAWFCDVGGALSRNRKVELPPVARHYPYGRLLAIAALFCALGVYAVFPQLRNFHGKVVMSHLMSLLLGNATLAAAVFLWRKVGIKYCSYFGIGTQYFFLASFCWLNVMCFDIFITFRTLGPVHKKTKNNRFKRFLICSLYAWGFPAVISAVTASLEWIPDLPDMIIRPNFERVCWFREKRGALLYFFGPVGVILTINVLLFVTTSIKIFTLQRETAKWESRRSVVLVRKMKKTKKRFNLYLKLSLMMGIGRAIGLLFWILDHPMRLFVVTDITEALQCALIFITYVWKDEVIVLFKKKFSSAFQQTTSVNSTDEVS